MSSSVENGSSSLGIGGKGPSRLLSKLTEAIDSKKYYEAHQLVKTISFRYLAGKKYSELEELLSKVSFILLDNAQYESGADVAIMLSKLYIDRDSGLPPTDSRLTTVLNLLQRMSPTSPERLKFIAEITDWVDQEPNMSGKFHNVVAKLYIGEHLYSDAWRHLIRTNDGKEAAELTRRIIIESFIRRDELDLVISMLVVGFLTLKKVKEAEAAYRALVRAEDFPDLSPLLNGVRFLVEAAKMNNPNTFSQIKDMYDPSFCREHHLRKLVVNAGKALWPDRTNNAGSSSVPMSMMMSAFLEQDQSPLD